MDSLGQPGEILIAGADDDSMMVRDQFMQLDEMPAIVSQDGTRVVDCQAKHGFIADASTGVARFLNRANVVTERTQVRDDR